MDDNWTTIESDPGVFTELIERMQTKGVEVVELWDTSIESLRSIEPIYGLIFLFKYEKDVERRQPDITATEKGVFFASQVIQNACATQALINVLFNIPQDGSEGFDPGPVLSQLKSFISDFDSQMKGLAIGNSDTIRTIHNSFHPPESIIPDDDKDQDTHGDAFHFIAYIPAANALYELDGLQEGPLKICECKKEEWLNHAAAAINDRIASYAATEQRFNLMAVVRNRKDVFTEMIEKLNVALEEARKRVEEENGSGKEDVQALERSVMDLQTQLGIEEEKRRKWSEENARRRTDFVPFAFNLLKELAMNGDLKGLVEEAEKRNG